MKKKNKIGFYSVIIAGVLFVLTISFKNNENHNLTNSNDETVTDIDGNVYKTVKIGTQTWMAENLKTTKYNDGTPIPNITSADDWSNLESGAQCDWGNNSSNLKIYGKLYNWYAVNSGKLCPKGWHVPAEKEWNETLWGYYNWGDSLGGKLKETGTSHWIAPNAGATNISGFTALPGGYRESNGTFTHLMDIGQWWTSTEESLGFAKGFNMQNTGINVWMVTRPKKWGTSVRLVKDY